MEESITKYMFWSELIKLIQHLKNSRESNTELIDSFNISIIFHSASIIEGVVSQVITDYIKFTDSSTSIENKLKKNFLERVEKASWKEVQELYKIAFNKKISEDVLDKTLKSISFLFQLRNLLTHGTTLDLSLELFKNKPIKNPEILNQKYKNIYHFLAIENNLIDKITVESSSARLEIITNESADYFWDTTRTFLIGILKKSTRCSSTTKLVFENALKKAGHNNIWA